MSFHYVIKMMIKVMRYYFRSYSVPYVMEHECFLVFLFQYFIYSTTSLMGLFIIISNEYCVDKEGRMM